VRDGSPGPAYSSAPSLDGNVISLSVVWQSVRDLFLPSHMIVATFFFVVIPCGNSTKKLPRSFGQQPGRGESWTLESAGATVAGVPQRR
jgi:hypothetical protein